MPRYFFHFHADAVDQDESGAELPDDSAAVEWGRLEARFKASLEVKEHARLDLQHGIVIADELGQEIDKVTFADVISVRS